MTEEVKIKILIEDVSQVKKDLNKVDGEVNGFMKKMTGNADVGGIAIGSALGMGIFSMVSKGIDLAKDAITTGLNFIIKSVQDSMAFEDQLASVRKAVGLTKDELKGFTNEFFELSRATRTSNEDLLKIAQIGGQLGIDKDEIIEFTKSIDTLAVALGDEFLGGAEQVTQEVGILANNLKDIAGTNVSDRLLKIGNALNVLGMEGLATGPVVTDIANRFAAAGQLAGISSGEILGLAATLQELGVNQEVAGSTLTRLTNIIGKNKNKVIDWFKSNKIAFDNQKFGINVNEDMNEAILQVADSLAKSKLNNEQLSDALKDMGFDGVYAGTVLKLLGQNVDTVREKQKLATEALTNSDSIREEFNIKNETAAANLAKFQKRLEEIGIKIGGSLSPALQGIIDKLVPIVDALLPEFTTWLENEAGPAIVGFVDDFVENLPQTKKELEDFVNRFKIFIGNIDLGLNFIKLSVQVITGAFMDLSIQIDELTVKFMQFRGDANGAAAAQERLTKNKADREALKKDMEATAEHMKDVGVGIKQAENQLKGIKNTGVAALDAINRKAIELFGSLSRIGQIRASQMGVAAGFGFDSGGVVPGSSFSGDRVPARLNSGEMVLTKGMQSALFSVLKQLANQPQVINNVNANFNGGSNSMGQERNNLVNLLM